MEKLGEATEEECCSSSSSWKQRLQTPQREAPRVPLLANIGDILASFLASVNTNKLFVWRIETLLFVKSDFTNNAANKKRGHCVCLFVYWGNKINFHYKYESQTVSATVKNFGEKADAVFL